MVDFVILAAGNGSRMKSSTPKVFKKIADKPCISYVIDTCREFCPKSKIIIVAREDLATSEYLNGTTVVIQTHPLGTADALKTALPFIDSEEIIVMCGDMPLVESADLSILLSNTHKVSFIATRLPSNMIGMPYGRVIGKSIVEYKDATEAQKKIDLINTGIYKLQTSFLQTNILNINNNNNNNEYYLTDILKFASSEDIEMKISDNYSAFHGINTMQDLATAEDHIQQRLRQKALDRGVKMLDPRSVYLSYETIIESDVVIEPNVVFKGKVEVHSGAIIKSFSYIEDSKIMQNVKVGPFARIRGNALLSSASEIGNFVEIKGSIIGQKSKAKHLSYIGDTILGERVNVGAGAITCNYDGFKKHKTMIGDDVMVGANTSLVAPIDIGRGSIIAAGSTITRDVPNDALAIAREKQENKENGAIKIRKSNSK